jgi:polysaccharide biosynthesis protein PslH
MRILWLKTELLHPVDKGGKIRTYYMLRALKQWHHITYLALDDGSASADAAQQAGEYCHEVMTVPHRMATKLSPAFYADLAANLVSSLPYAVGKYRSEAFRQAIEHQVGSGTVDLIVCDFLSPSVNLPAHLPCPVLLFQHNVEALIWQRHAEVRRHLLSRLYFREQWRRMRAYEQSVCRRCDGVVAVSAEDRALIQTDYGVRHVDEVPTGVDTSYFRPSRTVQAERFHLVFTGSMDWLPNDDAMSYFIQDVLPLIREVIPDVVLTIVGRKPFPRLQAISRLDSRIVVTGRVDDVRPYMERAAVYVIPLRIGGGTRLKVFEAMAMEMPIVSTSIGVEGLPVTDGEDVLIADHPPQFARAVLRALKEEAFAAKLGQQAAAKVRAQFGWERVAQTFARVCSTTVARHKRSMTAA